MQILTSRSLFYGFGQTVFWPMWPSLAVKWLCLLYIKFLSSLGDSNGYKLFFIDIDTILKLLTCLYHVLCTNFQRKMLCQKLTYLKIQISHSVFSRFFKVKCHLASLNLFIALLLQHVLSTTFICSVLTNLAALSLIMTLFWAIMSWEFYSATYGAII